MPDAFFVSNKTRKRKRSGAKEASTSKKPVIGKGRPVPGAKPKPNGSRRRDEELESDATQDDDVGGIDDLDLRASDTDPGVSGEEDELETPAEKRLRLAKVYLESVKEGLGTADGEFDAAELDRELIASRLKQDVMEHSGKMHKFMADSLEIADPPIYLRTRGHRQSVTAAVASSSGKYIFTSGKEGSIVRTDLSSGKQVSAFQKLRTESPEKGNGKGKGKGKEKASAEVHGHTDEVLALALSDDGKYLASGGKDRKLVVWDAEKGEWLRSFGGHKDTISCLAFRKGTHQLYTASLDRTLKLFDLSPSVMGYVDTLFGHQDHVVGLDALRAETTVSSGARDRTVRFWKVADETQLVFRGGGISKVREVLESGLEGLGDGDDDEGENANARRDVRDKGKEKRYEEGSVDCVAMVDENTFVSGGDSGSISVWTTAKKKPVFTQPLAHGLHEMLSETEGVVSTPRWITALACLRYGDVIVSGSWSSEIRLWKLAADLSPKARAPRLTLVGALPAPGIINSLQILTIPRTDAETWEWLSAKAKENNANSEVEGLLSSKNKGRGKKESLLVIAGIGTEPRLGRWMNTKGIGGGAANGGRVFVLHQREKAS
ncbi:WD40 repeat-like protein [Phellopilus nigrolimitatus]|nr:WD40 repeat-like protein [Phellopilus nigrolimitatus]